jgi:hypothetical protein
MRFSACHLGISLLALAVGPLLGFGARAQAGYLVTDPAARPAILDSSAGAGATATKVVEPQQKRNDENRSDAPWHSDRLLTTHHLWWMGLGQSGTGAGSIPTSSGSSGSALHATVGTRLALPPVQLTGWLYIDELQSRPPPFPSRLFRPPRLF